MLKNKITYLLKDFCDIITEFFQSVPLLIVLIISVLFFQMYIDNPDIRLSLTILVLSLFSSPKLSIQLEGIIKKLRKEEFILAAKASGLLVIPLVTEAGFGIGAGYDRGALLVNGTVKNNYSSISANTVCNP